MISRRVAQRINTVIFSKGCSERFCFIARILLGSFGLFSLSFRSVKNCHLNIINRHISDSSIRCFNPSHIGHNRLSKLIRIWNTIHQAIFANEIVHTRSPRFVFIIQRNRSCIFKR